MSRRTKKKINRKPNRFSRTSKQTPRVLKRLRGGTTQKDLIFLQNLLALKQQSPILKFKVEIADRIKTADSDMYRMHLYYMDALTKLIDDSLKLIKETYHDDTDVNKLKEEVDELMLVATPVNAKYYDLRDVYDMIVDFFYKKATNMLSSDTTFPSAA
jgi:hypothetical protein